MKYLTLLLCLLCLQTISTQNDLRFAVVKDKDGWSNIRDNQKNVVDKLNSNKLVYVYPSNDSDEWLDIDYVKNNITKDGIIHRSRLYDIDYLTKITCIAKKTMCYIFKNDFYEIKVSITPFDSINRSLNYAKAGNWLATIDNKYPWGAEVGIPKYQYSSIDIKKNGEIISIPKEALNDLFEPTLDSIKIFYSKNTNNLYITSLNSDGAGSYIAAWTIENQKYKERLVTHGF